jgi:hypothetical protein
MFRTATVIGVLAVLLAGCDSQVETSSNGAGSGGNGSGGNGNGASGGTGGAAGGKECSAFLGLECDPTEWCDYAANTCGGLDQSGVCKPRPMGCDLLYAPVCGCDGMVHGNECEAQSNGHDINLNGGCTAPGGSFACGAGFCELGTHYCEVIGSDVGGELTQYSCKSIPNGCGDCTCLMSEPCGANCEGIAQTGFTLTCLGG